MIKGLITGFSCFILFLVVHLIIFHIFSKSNERFKIIQNTFLAFIAVYLIMYVTIPRDIIILVPADPYLTSNLALVTSKIVNFGIGFMLYVFLYIGYCQFYFFIARTISGRMLIEIELSQNKRLTFEEMKNAYSPEDIFNRRIQQIIESNCIFESGGYFQNTKKGHFIAKTSGILKDFLKLGPGG